jgi:hypothetical protein
VRLLLQCYPSYRRLHGRTELDVPVGRRHRVCLRPLRCRPLQPVLQVNTLNPLPAFLPEVGYISERKRERCCQRE